MKIPVAYLRKSRVTTDRHVSWEVQEAAVKALAANAGDPEPTILFDWNKSGRKGRGGRPGYDQLLGMIERGEVSTLYSYSLSRLSRSLVDFAALVQICQVAGVQIKLAKEAHLDFSTASGRLMVNILASFAQMEAEIAQERARDTVEVRRARGDHIGGKHFEDTDRVVQAYRETDSVQGAARLLTSWKVPTRNGLAHWSASAVRSIIRRVAPDELPATRHRGAKRAAPFMFYRLLRCHCGRILTGRRGRNGKNYHYTSYFCTNVRSDVLHGPASIPETTILEWAQAEAALMCPPQDLIGIAEGVDEKRHALRGRQGRLKRAFVDDLMSEADYAEEKARIDMELASLDATGRAVRLEPINWGGDPVLVNQVLRALWSHIQMDDGQRPAFAEWLLPEWRLPEWRLAAV